MINSSSSSFFTSIFPSFFSSTRVAFKTSNRHMLTLAAAAPVLTATG